MLVLSEKVFIISTHRTSNVPLITGRQEVTHFTFLLCLDETTALKIYTQQTETSNEKINASEW